MEIRKFWKYRPMDASQFWVCLECRNHNLLMTKTANIFKFFSDSSVNFKWLMRAGVNDVPYTLQSYIIRMVRRWMENGHIYFSVFFFRISVGWRICLKNRFSACEWDCRRFYTCVIHVRGDWLNEIKFDSRKALAKVFLVLPDKYINVAAWNWRLIEKYFCPLWNDFFLFSARLSRHFAAIIFSHPLNVTCCKIFKENQTFVNQFNSRNVYVRDECAWQRNEIKL